MAKHKPIKTSVKENDTYESRLAICNVCNDNINGYCSYGGKSTCIKDYCKNKCKLLNNRKCPKGLW